MLSVQGPWNAVSAKIENEIGRRIDGAELDDDGYVFFADIERVNFQILVFGEFWQNFAVGFNGNDRVHLYLDRRANVFHQEKSASRRISHFDVQTSASDQISHIIVRVNICCNICLASLCTKISILQLKNGFNVVL